MKFGGTLFSENHTCLMNFTKNLGLAHQSAMETNRWEDPAWKTADWA